MIDSRLLFPLSKHTVIGVEVVKAGIVETVGFHCHGNALELPLVAAVKVLVVAIVAVRQRAPRVPALDKVTQVSEQKGQERKARKWRDRGRRGRSPTSKRLLPRRA